jgi:ABC-2 type transport system ATP-binding protein
VVIARGRLIADTTVRALVDTDSYVRIRTPEPERMRAALAGSGVRVGPGPDGALHAHGVAPATVGDLARTHGLTVHEMSTQSTSLEEIFLRLTGDPR